MKAFVRLPLIALLVLSAGSVLAARDSVLVPGKWIVELASPPGLAYEGGPAGQLETDTSAAGKSLAATAPHAIGQARYDAHSPAVLAYTAHLARERDTVLQRARGVLGRAIEPTRVYRHVFNGFEVHMDEAEARRLS
ncbi:MAG: hypothetical protein GVY32_02660, partial [Gammaproteobacteria bacterium]|nr:hypothetical protein [Gammaproteobacteria bacterium]